MISPAPIDCRTAVLRIWDYLDEELDEARMAEVTAHLQHCRGCEEHYTFARALLDTIRASRTHAPPPDSLRERVVSVLKKEGFTLA